MRGSRRSWISCADRADELWSLLCSSLRNSKSSSPGLFCIWVCILRVGCGLHLSFHSNRGGHSDPASRTWRTTSLDYRAQKTGKASRTIMGIWVMKCSHMPSGNHTLLSLSPKALVMFTLYHQKILMTHIRSTKGTLNTALLNSLQTGNGSLVSWEVAHLVQDIQC